MTIDAKVESKNNDLKCKFMRNFVKTLLSIYIILSKIKGKNVQTVDVILRREKCVREVGHVCTNFPRDGK